MTPLREHLLADMKAQNLPESTQQRYVYEVANLAKCCRKSPDLIASDELAEFLARRKRELTKSSYEISISALQFFFTQTLGRTWNRQRLSEAPCGGSELRNRMVQDMRLRNLAPKTQLEYVRWVIKFAQFYNRSPLQMGPEEVRGWLVHLVENEKKSVSSFTVAAASLRFLYVQTLGRQWALRYIPLPKREKKLPDVLSEEEVASVLDAPLTLKELALVSATYGGGLRTTEVSRLKVTDIDSRRMVIKIVQGKGRKDRYVALSKRLLEDLRKYWKESRPSTWLFPNKKGTGPISDDSVRRICNKAAQVSGLGKKLTPRTLRHCFATHLHERGEALSKIAVAMGHRSLRTTSIYARIATSSVCAMESPLDRLPKLS